MREALTIGILGVGHLIRHMMPAMVSSGHSFVLSARGRETARELSERFGLETVSDNQEIARRSDIAILAVRPWDALAVAGAIEWHEGQTVLSLCAGVGTQALAAAVSPARLILAMPVVAAEFGESPTLMLGEDADCRALLETCGPVVAVESEAQYLSAAVMATYYGWVHALIAEMAGWVTAQGIAPDAARLLTAQMTRAAATSVRENTEVPMQALIDDLATPGSFTGEGLEVLKEAGAFEPWRQAAEVIAGKYREK